MRRYRLAYPPQCLGWSSLHQIQLSKEDGQRGKSRIKGLCSLERAPSRVGLLHAEIDRTSRPIRGCELRIFAERFGDDLIGCAKIAQAHPESREDVLSRGVGAKAERRLKFALYIIDLTGADEDRPFDGSDRRRFWIELSCPPRR